MYLFIQQMEVINLKHGKGEEEKTKSCAFIQTEFYYC